MEAPSDEELDALQGMKIEGKLWLVRNHAVNYIRESKIRDEELRTVKRIWFRLFGQPDQRDEGGLE